MAPTTRYARSGDVHEVVAGIPGNGRLEVVGGDFFEAVPAGGDAYILSWILHDWDDERARQILRNCREAIVPGGRLLIVETILPRGTSRTSARCSTSPCS